MGNVLYLQRGLGDQKLFRLADPVGSQIFVGRAVQIPAEQPGQILGRDIDFPAHCLHAQREAVVHFDFFYHRKDIILIQGFLRKLLRIASVCKCQEHGVAADGELLLVRGMLAV